MFNNVLQNSIASSLSYKFILYFNAPSMESPEERWSTGGRCTNAQRAWEGCTFSNLLRLLPVTCYILVIIFIFMLTIILCHITGEESGGNWFMVVRLASKVIYLICYIQIMLDLRNRLILFRQRLCCTVFLLNKLRRNM